ncbi:MAG TPA: PepSY domain-containing protein [Candidatus Scatomonas pullistercoris]|uniref:PepSY domain-containing protein n=1 Tax=Candidatus Scatomonas pullistercoris TaxID=2840920 RepID=A0A9D1P5J0_9FIRM|nr:PepSY domain-containing protein [Candidatus Scatomonas pullistercoris]
MTRKVNFKKTCIALTSGILLAGMTACGSSQETAQVSTQPSRPASVTPETDSNEPAGTLLLSVNPEIEIAYDRTGDVLSLEGLNEDGKAVVSSCTGYEGQPCREVAGELVTAINEGGYFDTTIAGHEKNIILKLAKGSEYPHAEFLDEIADEIRITVETNQIGSQAVALDDDDYDDVLGEKGYIGEQAAQEIISAQLGRDDLQFTVKEYELDDGIYEIEFIMDGVEYEYEVDAVTGKVHEAERDDDGGAQIPAAGTPAPAAPSPTVPPQTGNFDDDWDDIYEDDRDDDDIDDDDWDDGPDDSYDDDYDDDWDDYYDDDSDDDRDDDDIDDNDWDDDNEDDDRDDDWDDMDDDQNDDDDDDD